MTAQSFDRVLAEIHGLRDVVETKFTALEERLERFEEESRTDRKDLRESVVELGEAFAFERGKSEAAAVARKHHAHHRQSDPVVVAHGRREDTVGGFLCENWKPIAAFFFPMQFILLAMAAALGPKFHSVVDHALEWWKAAK